MPCRGDQPRWLPAQPLPQQWIEGLQPPHQHQHRLEQTTAAAVLAAAESRSAAAPEQGQAFLGDGGIEADQDRGLRQALDQLQGAAIGELVITNQQQLLLLGQRHGQQFRDGPRGKVAAIEQ